MADAPQHSELSTEDLAWEHAAEGSFDFWDNPEDAIYDQLPAGGGHL